MEKCVWILRAFLMYIIVLLVQKSQQRFPMLVSPVPFLLLSHCFALSSEFIYHSCTMRQQGKQWQPNSKLHSQQTKIVAKATKQECLSIQLSQCEVSFRWGDGLRDKETLQEKADLIKELTNCHSEWCLFLNKEKSLERQAGCKTRWDFTGVWSINPTTGRSEPLCFWVQAEGRFWG